MINFASKNILSFPFVAMIFVLASFVIPQNADANEKICRQLMSDHPNANRAVFYKSSNGELLRLKPLGGRPNDIHGKHLYYLRTGIDAPGSVLVVKTAQDQNITKDKRVTLKRGKNYYKKNVVKNCYPGKEIEQLTKKFGKKVVSYKTYQQYAAAVNETAKGINKEDFETIKSWHFKFQNRRTKGTKNNYKCLGTDNIKDEDFTYSANNIFQTSLRKSLTGSQDFITRASKTFMQTVRNILTSEVETIAEKNAKESNWTVTLLAFDLKNESSARACVSIYIPELQAAKLVRLNDLEARPGGGHSSDLEYLGK